MDRPEKRRHRRLGAVYNISCRKIGSGENELHEGRTTNVSSGGLYFETSDDIFTAGNFIRIELFIEPTPGLLEFGGKIAGFAKVLRAANVTQSDMEAGKCGVAVEFCGPLRLCM